VGYFKNQYSSVRFPLALDGQQGIREAQLAAVHALSTHFYSRKDPALVVMPTGSGKTCVMLLTAFVVRATRVLVLTPSRMVRDQLTDAFRTLGQLRSIGAIDENFPTPKVQLLDSRPTDVPSWESLRDFDVVVGTVQSASPAIEGVATPPQDLFDLVICDEAHHEPAPTWRALIEHFAHSKKALFTATPFRRDDKSLRGHMVFTYPLSRAREDGVFGRLEFKPVQIEGGFSTDQALARAAQSVLTDVRHRGLKDLFMIRTSQRSRAEKLAEVYAAETTLRLQTIFGHHSQRRIKKTIESMRSGELDGVICVDMLGEGFDLPELKVAVLHSPHKSLAVTLQFIGRFARTNASNTGQARFLAIPSELQSEAQPLYLAGAEWNELVEQVSQQRIEEEQNVREVLGTFHAPAEDTGELSEEAAEDIDLASIAPYFHVKVYEVPGGVNLEAPFHPPVDGEPILLRRSPEHRALVCIVRDTSPCRWGRDDRLVDINHALFILYYDEATHHFFICSSHREMTVYDRIVETMVPGTHRRLSTQELNRVLRNLENPSFFSVGMRNRSGFGFGESYRMISGKSADKAIQKSDGRYYDRGHCFGRGKEGDHAVTIGFSSASKIWANRWDKLPSLFEWCATLGSKLNDSREVETHSGLDNLPLAQRATTFPSHIIAADWNEEVYKRDGLAIFLRDDSGTVSPIPVLDLGLKITSVTTDVMHFCILGDGFSLDVEYRLDRYPLFSCASEAPKCGTPDGRGGSSFLDFLREYPPAFFTSDLSRLEGDSLASRPAEDDGGYDVSRIEEYGWNDSRIDPLLEKPEPGRLKSIFEVLQDRLTASDSTVVFNDDGSGEVADYVTLKRQLDESTIACLHHCKAALQRPVPGNRVEDLYEVTGQAVKSVRFNDPQLLRSHLLRRLGRDSQRLVKGLRADIESLLRDGVQLQFQAVLVQPGVGRTLSTSQAHLLASTNAYMIAGQVAPLLVLGSSPHR
jgi:superfamily II DNA or RNA helicase